MINNNAFKPAIFLDRDGTIIEEVDHLSDVRDLKVYPFADEAIGILNRNGFHVIVVTNQSGIGRGFFDKDSMREVHDRIQLELSSVIDGFYFCPHLPDEGCICRKPKTGMIEAARRDFAIDIANSWMIGDKMIDVQTGKAAGMKSAMVLTGYGAEHKELLNGEADIIAKDLLHAAKQIINSDMGTGSADLSVV